MEYNRSSGGNASEISEILEPLHACVNEIYERDRRGKGHLIEYTDKDVRMVSILYAHVLGNRLIHLLTSERASIGLSQHLATSYGENIRELTKSMSGIDVSVYDKDKEKGS